MKKVTIIQESIPVEYIIQPVWEMHRVDGLSNYFIGNFQTEKQADEFLEMLENSSRD